MISESPRQHVPQEFVAGLMESEDIKDRLFNWKFVDFFKENNIDGKRKYEDRELVQLGQKFDEFYHHWWNKMSDPEIHATIDQAHQRFHAVVMLNLRKMQ